MGKVNAKKIIVCMLICTLSMFVFATKASEKQSNYSSPKKNKLITGESSSLPVMDSIVSVFMQRYKVQGVSVAIIKDEKLVYINSYGYQDKESKLPTTNNNLFRIASISKPITLVGLLTLVNQGKLLLDNTVLGEKGILGNDFGTVPVGSNKDKITIRNLIEHKSGWQNIPGDPMFMYSGMDQKGIIRELLANRPLATNPGDNYYYSNFSYCVLGRVIEKVSGMHYADFIKKYVLKPSGIKDMNIGGNTLSQRFPNEVKYYLQNQEDYSCYTMDITRMDSHGAWIASAADLARLMVHIDRNGRVKDLLPPEILSETYMKNKTWDHTGSLPGTAAIMRRQDDTFSYVILTNGRSEDSNFWNALSECGSYVLKKNKVWPSKDLFKEISW